MKKVLWGFVAVFVAINILDYIIHGVILKSAYEETANLWRPDMDSLTWIYLIISLIGSFFFSFIFSKGYEGKGWMEGARYGLYIGIWLSVGMAYGMYAMIAIPYALAFQWFIYGIIEYVLCGIILSFVFGMEKTEAPAAQ